MVKRDGVGDGGTEPQAEIVPVQLLSLLSSQGEEGTVGRKDKGQNNDICMI